MVKQIFIFIIRFYQLTLSAVIGPHCRFYPTCSEYAKQAIEIHGIVKGSSLSVKRICRCHPLHEGGVDLVPPNTDHEIG